MRKILAVFVAILGIVALGLFVYYSWNTIGKAIFSSVEKKEEIPPPVPATLSLVSPKEISAYVVTQTGAVAITKTGEVLSLEEGREEALGSVGAFSPPLHASL